MTPEQILDRVVARAKQADLDHRLLSKVIRENRSELLHLIAAEFGARLAPSDVWTKQKMAGVIKGRDTAYVHPSGMKVLNAGGFSCIYPWWIWDPRFPEHTLMTPSGRGFPHLRDAQDAVLKVLRGDEISTNENCDWETRVVVPDEKGLLPDWFAWRDAGFPSPKSDWEHAEVERRRLARGLAVRRELEEIQSDYHRLAEPRPGFDVWRKQEWEKANPGYGDAKKVAKWLQAGGVKLRTVWEALEHPRTSVRRR